MQLIQHQELASSQASITFTSIPQGYTDLYIVHSLRTNRAALVEPIGIVLNNNSLNRSSRQLEGDGSAASSSTTTDLLGGSAAGNTATASTFGNSSIYIPNYSGSNPKSLSVDGVTESNTATLFFGRIAAALWNDTTAITSFQLTMRAGGTAFLAGSSVTLYGITKGSDGVTTVS
jgi:hypothetical protein